MDLTVQTIKYIDIIFISINAVLSTTVFIAILSLKIVLNNQPC